MHQPHYQQTENARALCVLIHGFWGSPDQFDDLAAQLTLRGFAVLALLLPGHGSTGRDFAKYGVKDWENHVQTEIARYAPLYDKVYLIGHSMGGLLALSASLHPACRVAGVCLIFTPLKIQFLTSQALFGHIKMVLLKSHRDIRSTYFRAYSIGKTPLWVYPLWLKTVCALYQLMRQTAAQLSEVRVPVTLVHSASDETVAHKSADLLESGLIHCAVTRFTLKDSWHSYIAPKERQMLLDAVLHCVQGN